MIRFTCPKCQTALRAAAEQAGAAVACPRCQTQVRVPSSGSPEKKGARLPGVPAPQPAPAPAPSPAPWYYSRGGERHGPFTTNQLKQLAQTGELQPTDSVWKDGMPTCRPASEVKGLFDSPRPAQPTAKSVPPLPPPLASEDSAPFGGLGESDHPAQDDPVARPTKSGTLGRPVKLVMIGAAVTGPLLAVFALAVFLAGKSGRGTGTAETEKRPSAKDAAASEDDRGKGLPGGYAARAFKSTGKQPPKDFKPSPPGSTDDFLDALEILGLRPGNKFDSKPYAWIPIRGRGVTETTWIEVFGLPKRLPDGYDTLGRSKMAYQRWKHGLTDGPITMHGNIVTHGGVTEYLPVKACLY